MSDSRRLLTALLSLWTSTLTLAAQTHAITDINVVDIVNDRILPAQTVVVKDGIIVAVGPSNSLRVPANAKRIPAKSRYLIPGLWDMHVHLRSDEKHPDQPLIKENESLLDLFIPNGVVGIRDMGGDLSAHVIRWRDEIQAGKRVGPRILTCGSKIDQTRGRQWAGTLAVNTPHEARAAVQTMKQRGADFIKVRHASQHVLSAIIDEARRLGLKTTGHLPLTMSLQAFVRSGFDGMEHDMYLPVAKDDDFDGFLAERARREGTAWAMDGTEAAARLLFMQNGEQAEQVYRLMAQRRFWVTPTSAMSTHTYEHGFRDYKVDPRRRYIPGPIWATWDPETALRQPARGRRRDLLAVEIQRWKAATVGAYRHEVPMLAGTDCGANNSHLIPGWSMHEELEELVKIGFKPAEVLRMATSNAAEWRNESTSHGSIALGKVADLVILKNDPLQDIRSTRDIEAVFTRGKYYPREDLDAMLQRAERNASLALR
jgi:imidazolonepropionase-like amidohydrolase